MSNFLNCVIEQLRAQGFGDRRIQELADRYTGLADFHRARGDAMPEQLAATRMFNEVAFETAERRRVQVSNLMKYANWGARLSQFRGARGPSDLGKAVRAGVSGDPRAGALSVDAHAGALRSQLFNLVGEGILAVSKGVLGRQRGRAHLPNILRELDGTGTGDVAAAEVARGWRTMTEAVPRLWRQAGGAMNEIAGIYLPDTHTAANLYRHGQAQFVRDHMTRIDWDRTTWPNGRPIDPAAREEFLAEAWITKRNKGLNKGDRAGYGGTAQGFGNLLDQHRLLHYKSADDWGAMHAKYGDGNLFEAMVNYVEDVSHQIAMIRVWGASPQNMYDSVKKRALAQASRAGGTHLEAVEATLRTVDPMFDLDARKNPMDPESYVGNGVVTTGNLLTAAYLGGAVVLAVPGDFVTGVASRITSRGLGANSFGGMGSYLGALMTNRREAERIAIQTGFVMDEVLSTMYSHSRFTGINGAGPHWSRRVADTVMRASGLTAHTKAARYASRMEQMAFMAQTRNVAFDDHPMRGVFERYGITAADWDAMRVTPLYQPRPGVEMLAPTQAGADSQLFAKFQGMIWEESKAMVISASKESTAILRGVTRPDTLIGAIGYSFAMFKSFPVSLFLTYGRIAQTLSTGGKLGLIAGMGAAMTMVGALGVQMREVLNGRDPLEMDSAAFWGKSVLAGGALSVFGDFLFASANTYGSGPAEMIAGPPVVFAGDLANLATDDAYQWARFGLGLGDRPAKSLGFAVTDFASRNAPGSSLWYTKLALQREFFDRMKHLADPAAARRQDRARQRFRRREFGQDYFSAPGSSILDMRAPDFERAF